MHLWRIDRNAASALLLVTAACAFASTVSADGTTKLSCDLIPRIDLDGNADKRLRETVVVTIYDFGVSLNIYIAGAEIQTSMVSWAQALPTDKYPVTNNSDAGKSALSGTASMGFGKEELVIDRNTGLLSYRYHTIVKLKSGQKQMFTKTITGPGH